MYTFKNLKTTAEMRNKTFGNSLGHTSEIVDLKENTDLRQKSGGKGALGEGLC